MQLSLHQAAFPLFLLTLQFTGIACIDCSQGYPAGDGIIIDSTCYPNGRIEWLANVLVMSDTVRIVYNCTGPYAETGVPLPSTRNQGAESGSFQVMEWDYRTSICYFDGCYAEFAANFPKYSISTTPCTVISPSSVMDESSSVSPQQTSLLTALVPSSVTEEPTQSSAQEEPASLTSSRHTTSHLPAAPTVIATPQPSPLLDENSRTNGDKEMKIILIVAPSVSFVVLVLFLCFTCLLTFFSLMQRRVWKDEVDFRYFTDGKHEQVADVEHVVQVVAIRGSDSRETILEALRIDERAYEEEVDDEDSDCSFVLESCGRTEQEKDAHSECTTCSLSDSTHYNDDMSTYNHQKHSVETSGQSTEYVNHQSFVDETNEDGGCVIGACDDQSILELLVDVQNDPMPAQATALHQLDQPHINAEKFPPAKTHETTGNRMQPQDSWMVCETELPQGYGEQLPLDDSKLLQAQMSQSAEDNGQLPQAQQAEISQTDIRGQPEKLQVDEDSGFNSSGGYIKFNS